IHSSIATSSTASTLFAAIATAGISARSIRWPVCIVSSAIGRSSARDSSSKTGAGVVIGPPAARLPPGRPRLPENTLRVQCKSRSLLRVARAAGAGNRDPGGPMPLAPLTPETRNLIDGRLVPASNGAVFENLNPATGAVLGTCADGTKDDMEAAL